MTGATRDLLEPLWSGVVRPFRAWLAGDRSYARVRKVERLLALDGLALRARQLEDVRAMLIHARDTVPWHRERMERAGLRPEAIRSVEELAALSPLTREDLAAAPERLLSSAFAGQPLVEARTGGTTSAAVPFVQTRDAIAWKDAAAHALKQRMDWRSGHRSAYLWGAQQDGPPPATDWARRTKAAAKRRLDRTLWLPAGDLSDGRLDDFADQLRLFAPHALQGYPSAVDLLARRLLEKGRTLDVPVVLLTAEPVLPEPRQRIAAALHAEVFSFYGARECGWIASECAAEHRLHVNTAGVHLESDGEGRLLVTDLVNRAMPLLRYVIGDRGTLDPEPCPCGDARPVETSLEGRLNDVFFLPSGRRVPGA